MFTQICALTNNVIPQSFMTDYETGSMAALQSLYPNVPLKGFFFTFAKTDKYVQREGLSERYINDDNFRTNIKMISAIGFVPVDEVIQAFDELSTYCGNDEQVILDYFETNYIGEQRRGRRLSPRYPHEMWNVHARVEDNLPKNKQLS